MKIVWIQYYIYGIENSGEKALTAENLTMGDDDVPKVDLNPDVALEFTANHRQSMAAKALQEN